MTHVLISNGSTRRDSGERRVVMSPYGEIREIVKATRVASQDRRCTFQRVLDGDYVMELKWESVGATWGMCQIFDGQSIPQPMTEANAVIWQRLMAAMPPVLREWFRPHPLEDTYLPDGCGWTDGLTISDRRKRRTAEEFFRGLPQPWIDKILPVVQASPHEGLVYNWDKAGAMPAVMDAPHNRHEHPNGRLHVWTEWVLWYADGTVTNLAPLPTSGKTTSVIAGSECDFDHSAKPLIMPDYVVRACKITHGPYTRRAGRESYGIKWELYSKEGK